MTTKLRLKWTRQTEKVLRASAGPVYCQVFFWGGGEERSYEWSVNNGVSTLFSDVSPTFEEAQLQAETHALSWLRTGVMALGGEVLAPEEVKDVAAACRDSADHLFQQALFKSGDRFQAIGDRLDPPEPLLPPVVTDVEKVTTGVAVLKVGRPEPEPLTHVKVKFDPSVPVELRDKIAELLRQELLTIAKDR